MDPMRDRSYHELTFEAETSPDAVRCERQEGLRSVKAAYADELAQIVRALELGQSVLVTADKTLVPYIHSCLRELLGEMEMDHVAPLAAEERPLAPTMMDQLTHALAKLLRDAHTARHIVVIDHLDLMAWTITNEPRPGLNDVVYWLTEFGRVVKLAFWDPAFSRPPRLVEDLFPLRVSLQGFRREGLWKLVTAAEAKKISQSASHFTLTAQLTLYQYLSGTNVVEVRRILRQLTKESWADCGPSGDSTPVFKEIRKRTSASEGGALLADAEVAGYEKLRRQLERQVVFPFKRRQTASDPRELRQFDHLIPRGVILHGPPGCGKTEWAKWLAHELNATLLIIHGPELKHRLVGETEAAIRRLFTQARKLAPALILIDELDAMTPSREGGASNFEASMVGQFLTEMGGLHPHEAVLVVGTTNRIEAVDRAFKRPGRFGIQIEIDYPDRVDRKLILERYRDLFGLGVTDESILWLLDATQHSLEQTGAAAPGPASAPGGRGTVGQSPLRFSGDHLRAICLYLLGEQLYRREKAPQETHDVNVKEFLREAVDVIRQRSVSGAKGVTRGNGPGYERL